jgi:hypothetical protein
MFTFVFPTILHQPITELPTYVGLATLVLAQIGITRIRSNWRIGFWVIASVVGVTMALGTATPLVTLAYYLPPYSWFRNLSRHLLLFAFGASVLAGFGMAALERRTASRRSMRAALGVLAGVMLAGAVLMRAYPEAFPLEAPHGQPGPGPLVISTVGVWIQFAILLAVGIVCAWMVRKPSRVAPVVLTAIVVIDLLSALPYDIKPDGIEYYAVTEQQTHPSVHALAIGRAMEPTHARALAIGGTQVDDLLPATFARAWRIPIAGGYGAMLIDRVSRMATMGTNGEVRSGVLVDEDTTLDLLAVKYAIVNSEQLNDPERRQWLRGSGRWREAMHFKTSRESDRGADEHVEGETDVTVFENQRALPRAWLVQHVMSMEDGDAIRVVKSSRLPNGDPFDPRRIALIDTSMRLPEDHFAAGASEVRVDRIGDGDIGIRVSTAAGGFLVLSENAYPGWRARVDGAEVTIYRADVTLQGITVPAGTHRVEFTMESRSLRAGMTLSGIAALICVGLLIV